MKQFYLIIFAVCAVNLSIAQTTIFEDDFNNPAYETSFPPSGWVVLDADGDTHTWYWGFYSPDNDGYLLSRSFLNPNPLNPDNWIITPPINLNLPTSQDIALLQFTVCPTASTPQYRTEHYGVFISTTNQNPSSFTEIFSETLLETMTNWVWLDRQINISSYIGQTVYIAFRHWNSYDKDRVAINDFKVISQSSANIAENAYQMINVYPNPASNFIWVNTQTESLVEIFSPDGMLVASQKIANPITPVSISALPSGLYIVKITTDTFTTSHKLFIQK